MIHSAGPWASAAPQSSAPARAAMERRINVSYFGLDSDANRYRYFRPSAFSLGRRILDDVSAIVGTVSALKGALHIAKAMVGLHDVQAMQTKVIEPNSNNPLGPEQRPVIATRLRPYPFGGAVSGDRGSRHLHTPALLNSVTYTLKTATVGRFVRDGDRVDAFPVRWRDLDWPENRGRPRTQSSARDPTSFCALRRRGLDCRFRRAPRFSISVVGSALQCARCSGWVTTLLASISTSTGTPRRSPPPKWRPGLSLSICRTTGCHSRTARLTSVSATRYSNISPTIARRCRSYAIQQLPDEGAASTNCGRCRY